MRPKSAEDRRSRGARHGSDAVGLRIVIAYKFIKATSELLVGTVFLFLGSVGLADKLARAAREIRHHATEMWSIGLAERLIDVSTAHHVFVVAMALVVDGTVTLVEGWALHHRFRWSRWLVVGTTSLLLPVEAVTLVRHPTAGRAAVLLVNMVIVLYLIPRRDAFALKGERAQ
jgi:uncharacterized membrane protein (DUF2068 family)